MKKLFARSLMASAIALAAVGCGSSSSGGGTAASGETITGVASAPAGGIARFEEKNAFEIALNFIVSPVAAAITGLEPVKGASVELIRVDDMGAQIGDVLATTSTSITGDYTLTLPPGVNLAGNLIVRITGVGGAEMRAQVVDKSVDISPISEFILKKFIDEGADLDNLTTASVVKLTGQLEEFDLTAAPGVDLTSMLAQLETEVGAFVDNQIDIITVPAGNAATVAGSYRNAGFDFGLHDDDGQYGAGTFSTDLWMSDLTLEDGTTGVVNFTLNSEDSAWSNLQFFKNGGDPDTTWLSYYAEFETLTEKFAAQLNQNGVLSIDAPFEEEIDGHHAWRTPPSTLRFQKALNSNVFFALTEDAEVRYKTVDNDGDGYGDGEALDPNAREGDEVFRGLEVLAKKPSGMTDSDLVGNFGRVYIGTYLEDNGSIWLETEKNTLAFDGAGKLATGDATRDVLQRNGATVNSFEETKDTTQRNGQAIDLTGELAAASNMLVIVSNDGDIQSIGGENADGFINDSYDLIVFNESNGVNPDPQSSSASQSEFNTTVAVKLPTTQLDLSNKRYKVLFLGVAMYGVETEISNTRYDSELVISGAANGSFTAGSSSSVIKTTPYAEVTAESFKDAEEAFTYSLSPTGDMVVTAVSGTDTFIMDGYMSHDGSIGVFRTTLQENNAAPSELGVALLVEIN